MTWKEVKVAALHKMFAIEGDTPAYSDNTGQYISAMPAAANEAIQLLCGLGKGAVGSIVIEHEPVPGQAAALYDLSAWADDFWRLAEDSVRRRENGQVQHNPPYGFEGESKLLIWDGRRSVWEMEYYRRPPVVDAHTADEYELPFDGAVAVLLPLYIAAQVYKDDDIQQATVYRNEFETALERLRPATKPNEVFVNERGWI